jgi:hypothetical protein
MKKLKNLTEAEQLKAQLKYTDLLVDLIIEIAADRGDGDVADKIRDDMETPWYSISDEQQEEVDNLSCKLYILQATSNKTIQECPKCKKITAVLFEDKKLICYNKPCNFIGETKI